MLFQMRYNVLFRQFRLLTAQAGSIPAAIRLIFENCYKCNNFQFAEVIISWKNINVLVVDISPITFHQAKTAGIFALSVFGRMTHSLLLMMNPATLTME